MTTGTYSSYIKPKKKIELFVKKDDPISISLLKQVIYDSDYYSKQQIETRNIDTGTVLEKHGCIKDRFESRIICNTCSESRSKKYNLPVEIECNIASAIASETPFAIICPACNTNYMELIRDL